MNNDPNAFDMFESEIKGLELLSTSKTIKIPKVIYSSNVGNIAFLLLEYIEKGIANKDFWTNFGIQLADLHKTSNEYFGLDLDNRCQGSEDRVPFASSLLDNSVFCSVDLDHL